MTGPQSPRGKRAKGNQGEREVRNILEAAGFPVVNGAMAEPGVDLWINPEIAVEVKNNPWRVIGGTKRKELLAAADYQRARGRPHWVITHEAEGWQVAEIGRTPDGRIGLLLKRPLASLRRDSTPRHPGAEGALAPDTTPRADSGEE